MAGARHRAAGPPASSTTAPSGRSPSAGASLLAAGVTGVDRRASSPATRSTSPTPTAAPVARGLVNFDADEIPALLGRSTHDLKRELGAAYEREVVHRDDLVLL